MPYGPPAMRELIVGVREFLTEEVVPTVEEPLRYHVRVAIGALALVVRELELASSYTHAHGERLRSLGLSSDAELAQAIRAGMFDDRFHALRRMLTTDATERVAVSNPTELVARNDG